LRLYLDTAYIAKCYLNEPDAGAVRQLAEEADGLYSSNWCIAELSCIFLRHVRERRITRNEARALREVFLADIRSRAWNLVPLSERLLYKVEESLGQIPQSVYLRAGDAAHLVTARESGFEEVWSNDRHLLAAAGHFGLKGRSV
jgi:predicted nucleic acid-binding protein